MVYYGVQAPINVTDHLSDNVEREGTGGGGLRALTHHRVVMRVRANHSEVFASYTLERRSIF